MATVNLRGPVTTARLHVAEAHTKYGKNISSETLFRAHVIAATLALTGDHNEYVRHCERNGIQRKDSIWLDQLRYDQT